LGVAKVGKNLVYATKRYPGRHSHERPGGRLMLSILVVSVIVITFLFFYFAPRPLDDSFIYYLIGWLVFGSLAVYKQAKNVMAHRLVSSMLKKWGEAYYIYEFPPDWPVQRLLANIVLRLKGQGYRVRRIEVPRDIDVSELAFEQVVDAFRVEPVMKELYVLDTRSLNPIIKPGTGLASMGPARRVGAFMIRPVEKEIFTEEYDPLVKVTGNVLWDHEVDLIRSGHPSSIPKEYWE
jgi:hypothetical protein